MNGNYENEALRSRWKEFISDEPGLPLDYRKAIYGAMAEEVLSKRKPSPQITVPLLLRMMFKESTFDPTQVSSAGATGLMQLKPEAVKQSLIRRGLGDVEVNPEQLFDPKTNITAGVDYLDYLIKHFRGDLRAALQAYNIGPGAYKKGRRRPQYLKGLIE